MSIVEPVTVKSVSITFGKKEIAALKAVADVAAKRSYNPILETVLISSINGIVNAYATNLEMYANVEMMNNGVSDDIVRVAIPAKQVKTWKLGTTVTLSSEGFGKYSINGVTAYGLDVDGMPKHPELNAVYHETPVTSQYFNDLVACATHAATSELRPVLTSICHRNHALTATDGLRMFEVETYATFEDTIKIPANHVKTLSKLFNNNNAIMTYDTNLVCYDGPGIRVYVRQIDGSYPDTYRIWPQSFKHEGTITDVKTWIDTLKTAVKFSNKGKHPLTMKLFTDRVELSARDSENNKYNVSLPYNGNNETSITFNPLYLFDALNQFEDAVNVGIVNEKTPFTLSDGKNRRALVSPVLVR